MNTHLTGEDKKSAFSLTTEQTDRLISFSQRLNSGLLDLSSVNSIKEEFERCGIDNELVPALSFMLAGSHNKLKYLHLIAERMHEVGEKQLKHKLDSYIQKAVIKANLKHETESLNTEISLDTNPKEHLEQEPGIWHNDSHNKYLARLREEAGPEWRPVWVFPSYKKLLISLIQVVITIILVGAFCFVVSRVYKFIFAKCFGIVFKEGTTLTLFK